MKIDIGYPVHAQSGSDVNQTHSGSFIANFMKSVCPGKYTLLLSKAYYLICSSHDTTVPSEPLAPKSPALEFRSAFRHGHCLQARDGKLGVVITFLV